MTGAPHSSVKRYRELARTPTKHERQRELLLDGAHLLVEARASGLVVESAAFEQRALEDALLRRLAEQLAAESTDVFIVSRKVMASMSPVKTPSGVVAIARRPVTSLDTVLAAPQSLVVVAHDIQDPGNVGGIMRTAEASGATAFVATAATADPFGWKALRGSMGSALRLPIARAGLDDTLRALRTAGITTTALVPRDGLTLFGTDFREPVALFLGGEGPGLPDEVSNKMDRLISIPMHAPVESLNVGVAAALVLYEAFRQRQV
ncbi:MAG TPA: RNA methyltransferase [Vicinamibacterales bacterium]|nr:RNA methyltransferase [Vicinamibacterales bacterium]